MVRSFRRKLVVNGTVKYAFPRDYPLVDDERDMEYSFGFTYIHRKKRAATSATMRGSSVVNAAVDWTKLPGDTVIHLFSLLNYRDRGNLASSCKTWRTLGAAVYLWSYLDLREYRFGDAVAMALSSRCGELQRVRFRGVEAAESIIHLKAKNLREISGEFCRLLTDAKLLMIVARHELLETLVLGPDFCENITSDAIRAVAMCCPLLKRLRLSGLKVVDADAINSLAKNCVHLFDLGFMDCLQVDETAIGDVKSLRFLSVAGTSNLRWGVAAELWSKLPHLLGLDVSRTDIGPNAVQRIMWRGQSLRVMCALNCSGIEDDVSFVNDFGSRGFLDKVMVTSFSDVLKGVASLFPYDSMNGRNVLVGWRGRVMNVKLEEIMTWFEWILSHSLLRIAESNPPRLDSFWVSQGAALLVSLTQSSQEDVKERAVTGLAAFVLLVDGNASIDGQRAEAVMRSGGVQLLLKLARSWREGLQAESAKAISNLCVKANVAKAVADEGGVTILVNLARSMNRMVAGEAAGGLWNLSVGNDHKGGITEAGGVKALVDLIFKWSTSGDLVLERAAGALANLAADDKCSMEVVLAGGVRALVMLVRYCKLEGVQEQAARALANLAAHGDSNTNNAAVGKEAGAIESLVQLTRSPHDGVRQEAAGALWNLSFDVHNREAIGAGGGVQALVALAHYSFNASPRLQERAAGALWGLSVSEANSIIIVHEGGITPLIALARSEAKNVHEAAVGALWNIAFNPGNALRIVEERGVPPLVYLCSSSQSTMTRFMAALALAYIFDGRIGDAAMVGTSSGRVSESVSLDGARRRAFKTIEAFVLSFYDPQAFSVAAASSNPAELAQITEAVRIPEAGDLRCSGPEIGKFVVMLRNPSSILKTCAAFALLQFTIPGGRNAALHANFIHTAGMARILRTAAAAAASPLQAKIFARIVLRNLEHIC